jgi:hypothetical protein
MLPDCLANCCQVPERFLRSTFKIKLQLLNETETLKVHRNTFFWPSIRLNLGVERINNNTNNFLSSHIFHIYAKLMFFQGIRLGVIGKIYIFKLPFDL